LIYFTEAARLK